MHYVGFVGGYGETRVTEREGEEVGWADGEGVGRGANER